MSNINIPKILVDDFHLVAPRRAKSEASQIDSATSYIRLATHDSHSVCHIAIKTAEFLEHYEPE